MRITRGYKKRELLVVCEGIYRALLDVCDARVTAMPVSSEIQENKLGACVIEESRLVLKDNDLTRNVDGPLFMSQCSSQLVSVDNAPPPLPAVAAPTTRSDG
jgi:hypothetical protein